MTKLNTIMFCFCFQEMMARFPVISREEIQNLAKRAVSKNAVKTMNYFFLLFIDKEKLLRTQTPVCVCVCVFFF